tara:strand:- start:2598 stop:3641 length:1044 start_codon:yes stop_codon:yes gene_type:complete
MKAVILENLNSSLEIWDLEPDALQFGQVLVKMISSGLCGAQLQEIAGLKGNSKFLPHLLGHEGCGIVQETGQGVNKVKKGDKVIIHWRKGNGAESDFPKYIHKSSKISGGKATTLSEFSIVSENRITVVPDETDNDFCTLLGCGLSTGLGVINHDAKLKRGENVLVLGGGGVGLSCVLSAQIAKANKVGCVDISRSKKQLVQSSPFSAEFFHSSELGKVSKSFSKLDCIVDTTGSMVLVSQILPLLSDRGRCILISQPKVDDKLTIKEPLKLFPPEGLTIKTSQGGGFKPDLDIPCYIKLFKSNSSLLKEGVDKLVTHRYNLLQINDAITELCSGRTTGRILLNCDI